MHNDEFAGQGGSYILDPETGIRTRVEEPTQGHVRPVDSMPPRTQSRQSTVRQAGRGVDTGDPAAGDTSEGNALSSNTPDAPASPTSRRANLPVKMGSAPTALVTHIEEVAK